MAVAAAGGAGSADIDKLSREGWNNIYIIYTSYCIYGAGVRRAREERLSGCILYLKSVVTCRG